VQVLAWDFQKPEQATSNRTFYTKVLPTRASAPLAVDLKGSSRAPTVSIHRTGFKANDAHTAYLEMGSPKTLTAAQVSSLQGRTLDKPERRVVKVAASGAFSLKVPMRVNDVVLIKISPQ
jgi:xylan 1,4-beta-xylosidase